MDAAVWSLGDRGTLFTKTWFDEELGLVFDAKTGDTHLLDQSAIEILQSLEQSAGSIESLIEQLAGRFAPEDQGKLADFITTTLLQLRDIGLVSAFPV